MSWEVIENSLKPAGNVALNSVCDFFYAVASQVTAGMDYAAVGAGAEAAKIDWNNADN